MIIRTVEPGDMDAVVALWHEAGLTRPWNDPIADFHRKRAVQADMFYVATASDGVIGTALAGYDGHRGWIHYLAVSERARQRGVGRALVEKAEAALANLGCPKVQLQVRPDNDRVLSFYERLGYSTYDAINLGKRLVED